MGPVLTQLTPLHRSASDGKPWQGWLAHHQAMHRVCQTQHVAKASSAHRYSPLFKPNASWLL